MSKTAIIFSKEHARGLVTEILSHESTIFTAKCTNLNERQIADQVKGAIEESWNFSKPRSADVATYICTIARLAASGLRAHVGGCESDRLIKQFPTLLYDKHCAYGGEMLRRWGKLGIIISLSNKALRLEQLYSGAQNGVTEPLVDTWLDIIGYCALAYAMHEQGLLHGAPVYLFERKEDGEEYVLSDTLTVDRVTYNACGVITVMVERSLDK